MLAFARLGGIRPSEAILQDLYTKSVVLFEKLANAFLL